MATTDKTRYLDIEGLKKLWEKIKKADQDSIAAGVVSITSDESNTNFLKQYTISQGTTDIGTINIPKDLLATSGEVVDITTAQVASLNDPTITEAGKYIKMHIGGAESADFYIKVSDLIEYNTVGSTTSINMSMDGNHKITANIKEGGITSGMLDSSVTDLIKASHPVAGTNIYYNGDNENTINAYEYALLVSSGSPLTVSKSTASHTTTFTISHNKPAGLSVTGTSVLISPNTTTATSSTNLSFGGNINIPNFNVDKYGHVISHGIVDYKLPTETVYVSSSADSMSQQYYPTEGSTVASNYTAAKITVESVSGNEKMLSTNATENHPISISVIDALS